MLFPLTPPRSMIQVASPPAMVGRKAGLQHSAGDSRAPGGLGRPRRLNLRPLDRTRTTAISTADPLWFLEPRDHLPELTDLAR
jgi:hypothetical protein